MTAEEIQKLVDDRIAEILENDLVLTMDTSTSYECERVYYNIEVNLSYKGKVISNGYTSINARD